MDTQSEAIEDDAHSLDIVVNTTVTNKEPDTFNEHDEAIATFDSSDRVAVYACGMKDEKQNTDTVSEQCIEVEEISKEIITEDEDSKTEISTDKDNTEDSIEQRISVPTDETFEVLQNGQNTLPLAEETHELADDRIPEHTEECEHDETESIEGKETLQQEQYGPQISAPCVESNQSSCQSDQSTELCQAKPSDELGNNVQETIAETFQHDPQTYTEKSIQYIEGQLPVGQTETLVEQTFTAPPPSYFQHHNVHPQSATIPYPHEMQNTDTGEDQATQYRSESTSSAKSESGELIAVPSVPENWNYYQQTPNAVQTSYPQQYPQYVDYQMPVQQPLTFAQDQGHPRSTGDPMLPRVNDTDDIAAFVSQQAYLAVTGSAETCSVPKFIPTPTGQGRLKRPEVTDMEEPSESQPRKKQKKVVVPAGKTYN